MKTLHLSSKLLKTLLAAALLAPFACTATEAEDAPEPVWRDPVIVEQGENGHRLLTEKEAEEQARKREKKASENRKSEPDPGWIGDCYYYADGGYYHKDGVYWCPDMKTHYAEGLQYGNNALLSSQ